MAYNNAIPQPTDQLSQSQSDILNNFAYLQTYLQTDHGSVNSINQGLHKQSTYIPGSTPVLPAGYPGIYGKADSSTQNQLWSQFSIASGTTNIPFTSSILSTTASPTDVFGWTYLPSGILHMWGLAIVNGQATIIIPTGANIPVFAEILSMQLTVVNNTAGTDSNSFVRITSFGNTSFAVFASPRTVTGAGNCAFYWLAIGF